MGRIIAQTKVTNLADEGKSVHCGMFVDTGAAALILPAAWRSKLGSFPREESVELVLDNGEVVHGAACAPVEIEIDGYRPVVNEAVFVEAVEAEGAEEPLLGYVILAQAQAAVDVLGHRLVPVRYLDMK